MRTYQKWIEKEISILRKHNKKGNKWLAEKLNRDIDCVQWKRQQLRLTKSNIWSDFEINIIKDNYKTCTYFQILELLPNRNYKALVEKCIKLGYFPVTQDKNKWTSKEIEYLKNRSMFRTINQLSISLSRHSEKSIRNKIRELNLEYSITKVKHRVEHNKFCPYCNGRIKPRNRMNTHYRCLNCGKDNIPRIKLLSYPSKLTVSVYGVSEYIS